jgi:hypothetical protein
MWPRYYKAYFNFFTKVIGEKGIGKTLEEHVFSKEANTSSNGQNSLMLNRFMAILFHPLIHTSYGIEFGLEIIVVQGMYSYDGRLAPDC